MKCVSPFYLVREGIWVPCGKCNFCVKQKRAAWAFRLYQELKAAESAAFLTFTYSDEHAVYDVGSRLPTFEKSHVQNLLKRIRKKEAKLGRKSVRYYAVGEYGSNTGRPHYHALLFNLHSDTLGTIADIWGKGFIHHGKVEPASIMYVSGYIIDKVDDSIQGRTFPFALMSKGIGKNYLSPQMKKWHKRKRANFVSWGDGIPSPMARYYRDKIFSKMEKQVMGLEMEAKIDERFKSELERLQALHSSPLSYYHEKEIQAYKSIKVAKKAYQF